MAEPQRPTDFNLGQMSPPSPNNDSNSMSTSDITYQDACSSPDQLLDDAMNSNERLKIRECSDDDHLERLGRKVSEFITENRLTKQLTLTAITASHTTQSTATQHSENGY